MSNAQDLGAFALLGQSLRLLLADANTALKELPGWQKLVHIFWLFGPFILLIERSPADVWLSFLALLFLGRSLWLGDGSWLRHLWVRAIFVFWFACILSSAFSLMPVHSIGEAISWFRFPLFAMATAFWLGRDKRLLYAMILSIFCGMILMSGILIAEIFFEGFKDGRLTWPYGDAVPGNYLAKATMPAFLICAAFAARNKLPIASLAAVTLGASLAISMLTGERMNLILRIFSAGLAFSIMLLRVHNLLLMICVTALSITAVLFFSPDFYRLILQFFERIPTSTNSDYFVVFHGAWVIFTDNAILGVGTGNYRELCPQLTEGLLNFRCDNHPHNYYVQLLAETGMLGFTTGIFMVCTIIVTLFKAGRAVPQNAVVATAYIVPFGFFFPMQSTADFFGQWNNIFLWSAVAVSMATLNLWAAQR